MWLQSYRVNVHENDDETNDDEIWHFEIISSSSVDRIFTKATNRASNTLKDKTYQNETSSVACVGALTKRTMFVQAERMVYREYQNEENTSAQVDSHKRVSKT